VDLVSVEEEATQAQSGEERRRGESAGQEGGSVWKDRALRLQAEMDNYRRRQQRRADERIVEEKAELLRGFVEIVDNLEEALERMERSDPLYRAVELSYADMLKLLRREEVEPIASVGEPFDPQLHEAMAMVPPVPGQVPDLLVVEEEKRGYRMGERLLRPARVIVAARK
jgi:molecular chaperone GrpE